MSRWSKYEEGNASGYVPRNVGLTLPSRRAQDAALIDPIHVGLCQEWEALQAELTPLQAHRCMLDNEMYTLGIAAGTYEWNDPLKAPISARIVSTREEMWDISDLISALQKVGDVIKARLAARMSELDSE